jgi:hypothetical protein
MDIRAALGFSVTVMNLSQPTSVPSSELDMRGANPMDYAADRLCGTACLVKRRQEAGGNYSYPYQE